MVLQGFNVQIVADIQRDLPGGELRAFEGSVLSRGGGRTSFGVEFLRARNRGWLRYEGKRQDLVPSRAAAAEDAGFLFYFEMALGGVGDGGVELDVVAGVKVHIVGGDDVGAFDGDIVAGHQIDAIGAQAAGHGLGLVNLVARGGGLAGEEATALAYAGFVQAALSFAAGDRNVVAGGDLDIALGFDAGAVFNTRCVFAIVGAVPVDFTCFSRHMIMPHDFLSANPGKSMVT